MANACRENRLLARSYVFRLVAILHNLRLHKNIKHDIILYTAARLLFEPRVLSAVPWILHLLE